MILEKFTGFKTVNYPPEHFVNNQVLTVGIAPYAGGRFAPFNGTWLIPLGVPSTPVRASPCHPLQAGEGFFHAIYASLSDSFFTIREVMRNSTTTNTRNPHWALVLSEEAMKS